MPKNNPFRLEAILSSLPGRVGLVLLTMIVTAGAFSLISGFHHSFSDFIFMALMLTGMGIISGISARILLRKRTRTLQFVTALAALLIGLLLSGLLSQGNYGFTLFQRDSRLSLVKDILQILWSGLVAWLFVYAWSKPLQIRNQSPVPSQKETRKSAPKHKAAWFSFPRVSLPKIRLELPGFLTKASWLKMKETLVAHVQKSVIKIKDLFKWRPGGWMKPTNQVRLNPTLPAVKTNTDRLRLSRRPSSIKLVGDEEHICPFCLETVAKLDPRGRRICPRCKTWHHLDCWDVTGECQVPHQH